MSIAISAQGSTLQIGTGSGAAKTATAIQVGYPTILTIAAHGFNNGDVVTLAGFTGADAGLLNGQSVTVKNVTANTFAISIDTTGKTITVGANTVTPVAWTQVAGWKNWSGFDGEGSEIDTTDLSSTAKQWIIGLIDEGKLTLGFFFSKSDAGQMAMRAARSASALKNFKMTLPDGTTLSFTAYVKKFPNSGGVDQTIASDCDLRISGPVTIA